MRPQGDREGLVGLVVPVVVRRHLVPIKAATLATAALPPMVTPEVPAEK